MEGKKKIYILGAGGSSAIDLKPARLISEQTNAEISIIDDIGTERGYIEYKKIPELLKIQEELPSKNSIRQGCSNGHSYEKKGVKWVCKCGKEL